MILLLALPSAHFVRFAQCLRPCLKGIRFAHKFIIRIYCLKDNWVWGCAKKQHTILQTITLLPRACFCSFAKGKDRLHWDNLMLRSTQIRHKVKQTLQQPQRLFFMIYTIGGIKGGSGKTTLAISLTVMLANSGKKVLLVDADKQATATDFSQWRTETLKDTGFTSIQLSDMRVRSEVLKFKDDYDDIIIDAGGRDTASQRAALAVSDVLIVPFAPKSFDIWTLEQVVQLVKEMQIANPDLKTYALLNRVDGNEKDIQEARTYIEESEILPVLKNTLHERKAFASAAASGLAVTEFKPKNHKAIEELEALFDEILQRTRQKSKMVA